MSITRKIIDYAQRRFLNYLMMTGLIVLGASHVFQYGLVINNRHDILNNKAEEKLARTIDKRDVLGAVKRSKKHVLDVAERNREALSARLDVIDSAVDPEDKRRKLIAKVRHAIKENTDTKIGVKDLNRMAISVVDYSYQYNLSIPHVLAQIKRESNFVIKAKSRAGAQGLMQIMPKTMETEIVPKVGAKLNPWNIYDNIKAGCFYMSEMLHLNNGNYNDALRSYNFGYENVLKVKAGELDFSLKRMAEENGEEKEYLVDRHGRFIMNQNLDGFVEITLEHKYPRETRLYIRSINKWIEVFKGYGLEE